MSQRKKEAFSSFVQSGNFETSRVTEFEPATLRMAVRSLIHYTKFPYRKKAKTVTYFAVSPVVITSNRQILLKSRKDIIALFSQTIGPICLKFSKKILKHS